MIEEARSWPYALGQGFKLGARLTKELAYGLESTLLGGTAFCAGAL